MKKILLVCLAVATVATVNAQARIGIKAGAGYSGYEISAQGISPTIDLGRKLGGYGGFVFNVPFGYTWGFQADLLYAYEGAAVKVGKDFLSDIMASPVGSSVAGYIPTELQGKNLALSANAHQIRLSAMLTFTPNDGITVMAGPYASYRLGNNIRMNDNLESAIKSIQGVTDEMIDQYTKAGQNLLNDNIKKLDVGVSMGVEYAFCSGIFIDFRYNLGLMNLLESNIDYTSLPGFENAAIVNVKDYIGATPTVKYHSIQLGLGYRF